MPAFNSTILWPIVTSLIASLIFYFLTPWVRKGGLVFVATLSKWNKKYSNYLYESLTKQSPIEFILSTIFLLPLVMLLIFFILLHNESSRLDFQRFETTWQIDRHTKELKTINRTLQELDSTLKKRTDSAVAKDPQAFYNRQIARLKGEKSYHTRELSAERNKKNSTALNTYVEYGRWLFLVFAIIAFIEYSQSQFLLDKKVKFDNDIDIIRPILTDKEYYQLRQEWALIKTKVDFENITNKINGYLQKVVPS